MGWWRRKEGDGASSWMTMMQICKCEKIHEQEQVCWKARLSTAFRTGMGCVLYALLLYVIQDRMHKTWMAFPIFGYVIVVRVVGESTVGKAILESSAMVLGAAQGMSMALPVLYLFPPTILFSNIGFSAACIFLSSFLITLPKSINIFHKRVALAHTSIIYITALAQREHMELLFPLQLFATTIFAATCGMFALVLPLPRLALSQMQSQTTIALLVANQQLAALVNGFCADHVEQALALIKAKSLGKVAYSIHKDIDSMKDDLKRETRFFPCHNTSRGLQHVNNALASLHKILVGLELALQANVTSKRLQGSIMRESLIYVTKWVSSALGEMTGSLKQQVSILEEEHKVLCSFDKTLAALREKVGYPNASDIKSFVEVTKFLESEHHDAESHCTHCNGDTLHQNHGVSEMMGTMPKAAEDRFECRIAIDEPGDDGSVPSCKSFPSMLDNENGALISFEEQAATAFFLFNIKRFVVEMGHILQSCKDGSPKTAKKSQVFPAVQMHEVATHHVPHDHHIQQSSVQNAALQRQPFQKLCAKCTSGRETAHDKSFWQRCLDHCSFKLDLQQLKSVFRLSLTMAIASILGFAFNNQRGYWADITVAMGFRALLKKDVFKIASLRTLGISCGSIYGLLVAMGLRALLQRVVFKIASLHTLGISGGSIYGLLVAISTMNLPALKFAALFPWAILTSFLRESKIFNYGGGMSLFTAAVVILASKPSKDYSDQEFTIIRIVEALLGLASFVVVEMLVFPDRARSKVKPRMIVGAKELQNFATSILETYSNEHCDVCRTDELRNKQKKLKTTISKQIELVEEAAEEPQFWFVPFHAKPFSKVMEEQKKVFEMIQVSIDGLDGINRLAGGKIGMDKLLQGGLKEALSIALEKKVIPTLEFLAGVLGASNETEEQLTTSFQALSDEGCMEAFERGAIQVVYAMGSNEHNRANNPEDCSKPESGFDKLSKTEESFSNSVFLSLGTLAFAIKGLLHHTAELQKVSLEILESEKPACQTKHKKQT